MSNPPASREHIFDMDRAHARGSVLYREKNLWALLRIKIIDDDFFSLPGIGARAARLGRLRDMPRLFFSALRVRRRALRRHSWVLLTDSLEVKRVDGKNVDKMLHPLIEHLGDELTIVCETFGAAGLPDDYAYDDVLRLDFIALAAKILYVLWFRHRDIRFFSPKARELDSADNVRHLKRFLAYRAAWRSFFFLVGAERFIVNCYYDVVRQAAVAAAHDRGIFVDEIQHGSITSTHFSYIAGAALDPYCLPDRLLALGDAARVANYIGGPERVAVIGSWYLGELEKKSSLAAADPWFARLRDRYELIVAVTGQWPVQERLLEFLKAAAPRDPGIGIVYVPRSRADLDRRVFADNLMLADERFDAYACMAACDVHATVYSTCALEALSMGKPDVLIDIDAMATQYIRPSLAPSDYARYISDPADFSRAVRDAPRDPDAAKTIGRLFYASFDGTEALRIIMSKN